MPTNRKKVLNLIFKFLKYLQPTHYFSSKKSNGFSVFPIYEELPFEIKKQLYKDSRFESEIAKHYDCAWQAIYKGYIGNTRTYESFDKLSVHDNYVFIHKYFNRAWVTYVLLIRLFLLNNPLLEIKCWWKTRNVKRYNYENEPLKGTSLKGYKSKLIDSKPLVSVIIPTLNRHNYISEVLKDFEAQDYKNFELIIVDQSDEIPIDFYKKFKLKINLIKQDEKALWLARNIAIKSSIGSFIALSEDDVRIPKDWISSHLQCLDFFDASVSAGVFFPEGKSIPKSRSFFAVASQFATGNAMVKKDVFEQIGLFDRQFEKQRMGDGEFGLRAFRANVKCISNPYAYCLDVKAPTGGLREMGSWDAFRPSKFLSPRPIPSVIYYYRSYFGQQATKLALLRTVPFSLFSYKLKRNKPMLIIAFLFAILIVPIICYQVFRSWQLASLKINEGPQISRL